MRHSFPLFTGLLLLLASAAAGAQQVSTVVRAPVGDDMAVAPDGAFRTSSYTGTEIRRITTDGRIEVIRDGLSGVGAIAVDPQDGSIFITGYDAGWVMNLGPDGTRSDTIATGLDGPAGIQVSRSGDLLVATNAAHAIVRIPKTGGRPTVVARGAPLDWPTGFVEAPDGTLYVANMFRAELVEVPLDAAPRVIASLPTGGGDFQLAYMTMFEDRIYLAHLDLGRIYEIERDGSFRVLAGGGRSGHRDGVGEDALFHHPGGVAVWPGSRALAVTDSGEGDEALRRVDLPEERSGARPRTDPRPPGGSPARGSTTEGS